MCTQREQETDQTECVSILLKACLLISLRFRLRSPRTAHSNHLQTPRYRPASPQLLAFLYHRAGEFWILIGQEVLSHFLQQVHINALVVATQSRTCTMG